MRRKIIYLLLLLISVFLFFIYSVCSVSGVGISPTEIRAQNIVGSGIIGSITLVNTVNESRHFIIEIQSPPELSSEQQHLRVICEDCHDTFQRYEIINSICPKCGSSNLIVYDQIPENVLKYLSLEGKDCNLIKNGSLYITEEQYDFKEECNVYILIDLPIEEEYSNKNWEAHISVTTATNFSSMNMGVAAGVQMRLLLDTSDIYPSLMPFQGDGLLYIIVAICLGLFFVVIFYMKRITIKEIIAKYKNSRYMDHNKIKFNKKQSSSYYLDKGNENISSIDYLKVDSSKSVIQISEPSVKSSFVYKIKAIEDKVDALLDKSKK